MIDLFPPFDPGRRGIRRRHQLRIRRLPMRLILPNLVTLFALCSGLTAVRMALENRYDLAILAVVFAAVLDGLDGRVARMLKSTSRFGAELDSLTDFVNFGVAPGVLLYCWTLRDLHSIGWIVVLVFSIAAALRLARFNVALDDVGRPAWQANFFTGVPSPAGAICALLPINLGLLGVIEPGRETAIVVAFYTVAMGLLMVSQLPTFSGKKLGKRVRRDLVLPLFVCVVLVGALFVSYPFEMFTLGSVIYLAFLPAGAIWWRRLAAADEASHKPASPEEQPAAPPPAA